MVAGSGPNWRNGAMLFQREDRWIVSVGGYFGDLAPDDAQMFAAYAGSFPTSDIYDIVAHAEPLCDFVLSLSRQSAAALRAADAFSEELSGVRRRRLQLQSGLRPGHDGGGAGGDAAARGAFAAAPPIWRGASSRAAKVIDTPWDIAVGNDLRHPQVEGAAPGEGEVHQLVHRQAAPGGA